MTIYRVTYERNSDGSRHVHHIANCASLLAACRYAQATAAHDWTVYDVRPDHDVLPLPVGMEVTE